MKAKFPKAEIHKWTKEKEGDIVVYDIEFQQEDRKFEADIKEDGTIHNWEKQIPVKDLPDAVRKAVETKYPKAALKEVLAITAVKETRRKVTRSSSKPPTRRKSKSRWRPMANSLRTPGRRSDLGLTRRCT